MRIDELETIWRRRDERYALAKRSLSDNEAEAVRIYRMREAETLLAGDESRIARNHAYGWDRPLVWG